MDFVFETSYEEEVYDTRRRGSHNGNIDSNSNIPIPSAPLKIPNFQIQNDITKKFSNLKILRNISGSVNSQFSNNVSSTVFPDPNQQLNSENALAFKYAKNSLDLISYNSAGSSISDSTAAVVHALHDSKSKSNDSSSSDNILGNRLSRVLNQTNYDSSVKDSLQFLQAKISESDNNKTKKDTSEKKADRLEHDDLNVNYRNITSPTILGSIARRKLRGDVESDLLKQHFSSLKKFQIIVKKLNYVNQDLDDLNSCFNEIDENLNKNISGNDKLEIEVRNLIKERDTVKVKRAFLNSFKANFTLNHYEEHYLTSENVDDEYFRILNKVNKLYQNCDILLSMNNDKLGITIMNKMSHLMDLATERISNGLKKQLSLIYLQSNYNKDQDSINIFQKSLIFILQKDKDKFDSIVAEIIESRSHIISDDFVNQLNGYSKEVEQSTKNGRGSHHQTLFMSSYDSKRFISDLLAYLHNVIVNELELAESLFNFDQGELINKDLGLVIQFVVNKVIGSLSTTLRGSFESILRQESKPVVITELYQLVDLYCMMYSKLIDANNSELLITLNNLKDDIVEKLFNLVRLKLRELKVEAESESEEIDEDLLNLPDWLIDFFAKFLPIFNKASSTEKFMGLDDEKLQQLFVLLIDDPIELLIKVTKNLNISKKSKEIYKINCIEYIKSQIEVVPLLSSKTSQINEILTVLVKTLTKGEFDELLHNAGLFDIYNLVNMIFKLEDDFFEVSVYQPITENKMFNLTTFQTADLRLQEFLITYIVSNELNKLLSPMILNDVSIDSSVEFVNFYYKLLLILKDYLKDGDGNSIKVFKWDDFHVATLLGVENAYMSQNIDREFEEDKHYDD